MTYPKVYKEGSTSVLVPEQTDNLIEEPVYTTISNSDNAMVDPEDVYIIDSSAALNVVSDDKISWTYNSFENGTNTTEDVVIDNPYATGTYDLAPGKYTNITSTNGITNEDGSAIPKTIYVF